MVVNFIYITFVERKIMNKIKAVLEVICMVLLPLLIANLFIYVIGCFIAWDMNPMNWWLFTTIVGRVFYIIYFVIVLVVDIMHQLFGTKLIKKIWKDKLNG